MTVKPEVNVLPMGTKPIQIPACEFGAHNFQVSATAFSDERGALSNLAQVSHLLFLKGAVHRVSM